MNTSRWLFLSVSVPWLAYMLGWGTDAGLPVPVLLLLVWGGLALLLFWLVRLVRHVRATRRSPAERHLKRVLWEPLVVLTCAALVWSGAGFRVRFIASEASLNQMVRAAHLSASAARGLVGTRVGLFTIREAEVLPGGTVRVITTSCMFDDCGVVFTPDGSPPPRIGEDSYSALGGGWWRWWRSW
jgi:hypothetical protein